MKVLYDISVLGRGYRSPKSRTGVFRVVENMARHLAASEQCAVKFCSNTDRETLEYSVSYLKENSEFSATPFSKPPFFDERLRISKKKDALINLIVNDGQLSSMQRVRLKLKIKELLVMERVYKLFNNDLVNPRDVRKSDIYHSPFFALSDQIRKSGYKSLFLTCYDLIPILFPGYFEEGILNLMKEILASITRETWILCISESTRNDLLNYLGDRLTPERVIVTELAASDTFYQSKDKLKNLQIRAKVQIPDVPYILSLCTFEPRKNIVQVIKAFARIIVQENLKDLYLVLVGTKGWMFETIFDEISDNTALKERIIITGYVADEDLSAIYSDALFFVYPSFYEGFGLPPLEAMKCGTPVITSNTSSLPEVVGDAGIMVAPSDLDALCQAMLSVYKSPGLRQELTVKSLARASNFSWERCAAKTIQAYDASLKS